MYIKHVDHICNLHTKVCPLFWSVEFTGTVSVPFENNSCKSIDLLESLFMYNVMLTVFTKQANFRQRQQKSGHLLCFWPLTYTLFIYGV